MAHLPLRAAEDLKSLRETVPLIHNITNFVVMNYTANALLAAGASPVMAHAHNEVEEMVGLAGALVLNIGTLTDEWIASMILAGKKANELGTPVILDPVGAGATTLRTASAHRIMEEVKISVLRGNASEIRSLGAEDASTKGVDSVHSVDDAAEIAKGLADSLSTTLAITGAVDLITDGSSVLRVSNGHPLLSRVTGTGCTATALLGAFLAVEKDSMVASAAGLAYLGLAAERAAATAAGPGSFQVQLLDELCAVQPEDLEQGARIEKG